MTSPSDVRPAGLAAFSPPSREARADADISALKSQIDARLESLFDGGRDPSRLACAIRHGLLSPGKRLRPLITLLACIQSGGRVNDALDAAVAVELVHAASLMMDDLPAMDNARLRRGCLTTHTVFGEGTAMLATIALLNEAYSLVSTMEALSPQRRLACVRALTDAIGVKGLTGGQERDITCHRDHAAGHTLADVEQRHMEKTGALFIAAAVLGGHCARADDTVLSALKAYGGYLGLAYQAFDDMIDQQCSSKTGKDTDQDTDKSTVVTIMGADGAAHRAERYLSDAIERAERAHAQAHGAPSDATVPLASLAELIGRKFGALKSAN